MKYIIVDQKDIFYIIIYYIILLIFVNTLITFNDCHIPNNLQLYK